MNALKVFYIKHKIINMILEKEKRKLSTSSIRPIQSDHKLPWYIIMSAPQTPSKATYCNSVKSAIKQCYNTCEQMLCTIFHTTQSLVCHIYVINHL